jgi:phage shock protein PspC (stress-responsive transcriptional regulator)
MKATNDDGLIGGVCAYLGKHTPLPIWLWRLMFIVTPGSSILYLILWLLLD